LIRQALQTECVHGSVRGRRQTVTSAASSHSNVSVQMGHSGGPMVETPEGDDDDDDEDEAAAGEGAGAAMRMRVTLVQLQALVVVWCCCCDCAECKKGDE
jgi:hypothetical protein